MRFRIFYCLLFLVFASVVSSVSAYNIGNRWQNTAMGSGFEMGDPTTLSWGFVPDGTAQVNDFGEGTSDLIAFFDMVVGEGPGGADLTQRPWFPAVESSFDRWAELSGLSYVYEPNDDGVNFASRENHAAGVVGVRADVRIGGLFVDGPSGTLAYNFFPDNGDMTFDTGDPGFYGASGGDYLRIRNVTAHEHGHGMGLFHVISSRRMLMNPTYSSIFDGPQFDDILGAQRMYGDAYEKSNGGAGNDIAENAIDLGAVAVGSPVVIGTDANLNRIRPFHNDFVSIDDDSDIDFFSFTIAEDANVRLAVTPAGLPYAAGQQGGDDPVNYPVNAFSDLEIALFDVDQSTMLAMDNSGGLTESDIIRQEGLPAGTYSVRITGDADEIQMYELSISEFVVGDFSDDGVFDCSDIDALVEQVAAGTGTIEFDLNGDGAVDAADITTWLEIAGAANLASGSSYLAGDANLDGAVDIEDFNVWNTNEFSTTAHWCAGDFNADGSVDVSDFNIWNLNKWQTVADVRAVPEPSTILPLLLSGLLLWTSKRRVAA